MITFDVNKNPTGTNKMIDALNSMCAVLDKKSESLKGMVVITETYLCPCGAMTVTENKSLHPRGENTISLSSEKCGL